MFGRRDYFYCFKKNLRIIVNLKIKSKLRGILVSFLPFLILLQLRQTKKKTNEWGKKKESDTNLRISQQNQRITTTTKSLLIFHNGDPRRDTNTSTWFAYICIYIYIFIMSLKRRVAFVVVVNCWVSFGDYEFRIWLLSSNPIHLQSFLFDETEREFRTEEKIQGYLVGGACSEWEWVLVRILRVLLHAKFHYKYNTNFYNQVRQMEYDNNEH